jgi:transcription elongation factor GreA
LQRLFDNPLDNPETFAWALKATLDGSWKHMEDDFPAQAMIPELIDQMDQWQGIAEDATHPRERREAARKLLSRGRTLLLADHFELLSLAVEEMQRDMANRLRRKIQTNAALNAAFKSQADRAITLTRRDLEETAEGTATGGAGSATGSGANDGVFLCTPRAQAKAMAELREIASVLIPKNAKVIGEARAEGDLSENAGYHYAKEEQKMLVQKQATLSDLLSRARVVRAEDVDAGRVGFGTRFTVRNEQSGETEAYTLLGRWEADAEHNVLSEQAPLARQFAGRKVGERLRVQRPGAPSTDYEILAIENALSAGPWDSAEA